MTDDGSRIDHVGVAVEDLEQARGLFQQLLGVEADVEDVPSEQVRIAMLPIGESKIELLEPTQDDSPVGNFLASRGEGVHQVAIRVDDIHATLKRAEDLGIRALGEVREGAEGAKVCFLHPKDCHGVLLELVERG